MAGGKKKKKPAANPARGFATTSIASKPKAQVLEPSTPSNDPPETADTQQNESGPAIPRGADSSQPNEKTLTAEEFEKQLEDAELQVLVEKYAVKSKRDALRQKTRLETDRRVLRGQANNLNTRKWLPPGLMEETLELIKADGRYAGQANDTPDVSKQPSEEELTVRLWTLQQALVGSGFTEEKVIQALRHILNISEKIAVGNKDLIWGMEESLDWLCRECLRDELPDYENWQRKGGITSYSETGKLPYITLQVLSLIVNPRNPNR